LFAGTPSGCRGSALGLFARLLPESLLFRRQSFPLPRKFRTDQGFLFG
jgi:hypothetical protein